MSGYFITFEGIDFCGKSEQSQRLARKLQQKNKSVILIRDPGTTQISEQIREILLNAKINNMCRETELLLFEAARAQMVAETILPALNDDKFVICDRFYDSTTAYQGYGRLLDLKFINEVNRFASNHREPDLTFFLDVSPDVALKRQTHARQKSDRMEREPLEFKLRIRNGFLEIARLAPERFIVLNGNESIETIEEQIREHVWERMNIN